MLPEWYLTSCHKSMTDGIIVPQREPRTLMFISKTSRLIGDLMSDSSEGLSFAGLSIGGFRSFYGAPQEIAPLGKVTLLVGPNNSGKSNVLSAVHRLFPVLRHNNMANLEVRGHLIDLDIPVMADGMDPRPLQIGVAGRVLSSDPTTSLIRSLPKEIHPGTNVMALLDRIATSDALRGKNDKSDNVVWFCWCEVNNRFQRDEGQINALLTEISGSEDLLAQLSLDLFQASSPRPSENLGTFLSRWESTLLIPQEVVIPSLRQIISDGNPSANLRDNSGLGLPGTLQALQSPSATNYRSDRAKFQRINNFMKRVLEDDSIEIIVPYDSKTVHISIGDRVLPLENLGAGLSQILLIAAVSTWHDNALITLEEPETNLNPLMLRKLVRYLRDDTANQYLMTTHSPNLLDDPTVTVLQVSYHEQSGTEVLNALTASRRAAIAQHLGYRPSDLIQANSIVWVEGPSDRIYLNNWIEALAPNLIEGAHYSIMFYGGRLLSHLTGEEAELPQENLDDFISLLNINRRMVIVIDSDRGSDEEDINDTKKRVAESFEENGGIAWITSGREIENYVPLDIFEESLRKAHPSVQPQLDTSAYEDRFDSITAKRGKSQGRIKSPNKVRVAEKAIEISPKEVWDFLDLRGQMDKLIDYLYKANDLQRPYRQAARK